MKTNPNKEKKPEKKESRISTLSPLNFQFTVHLTEEDLSEYNVDIEKIETVNDLSFVADNEELYDKVQLSSSNSVVNTMYYVNKAYSTRTFVEIIALQGLKYTEEDEMFEDVIKHVTETKGFIFLKGLTFNCPPKVSFQVKCGKKLSKSISICIPKQNENDEQKDDKTLEKEKKKKMNKIVNSLALFDYFYLDLNELLNIEDILTLEDIKNIVKKAMNTHQNLNLIVSCPNVIDNVNMVSMDSFGFIEEILGYADICLFEKKDALLFFNTLSIFSGGQDYGHPQDKHLEPLFLDVISVLRKGRKKIGLFLDDFNKFHVIEKDGKHILNRNTYEFQLHPRINHTNQKLVDEYRKYIVLNYQLLKSVFMGGFLSRLVNKQPLYPSFMVGAEITKRVVEMLKNKLDFPFGSEFYNVKLPKTKIQKELELEQLRKQEQKFVLDCVNRNSAQIRHYNPLFDDHLYSYFASSIVRKQLKEKGFIDTRGYILYDAVYRGSMGGSPKRKGTIPNETEKEKQLLHAIRQKNFIVKIN
jgi:hypothetical protein